MTTITDAFPELERTRQFFPVGVDNPSKLRPDQIQQFNGQGYKNSIICRGNDRSGHWADNPRPEGDYIPERVAA